MVTDKMSYRLNRPNALIRLIIYPIYPTKKLLDAEAPSRIQTKKMRLRRVAFFVLG